MELDENCVTAGAGGRREQGHGGDGGENEDDDGHRHGGAFAAEAGERCDDTGRAPLQEAEQRRPGAGVVGHLGRGERAGVGADESLGGHQHEEADDGHDQRHLEPQRPDEQQEHAGDPGGDEADRR